MACLCGDADDTYSIDQKLDPMATSPGPTDTDIADEVVYVLRTAEKNGSELKTQVCDVISAEGWTENIAKAVLRALEYIIQKWREKVGNALREAIDAAEAAANACFTFAKEHPYLTGGLLIIVAVGVLVWMAPWAVEALGFGMRGPIASMFSTRCVFWTMCSYADRIRHLCGCLAANLCWLCPQGVSLLFLSATWYDVEMIATT